LVKVDHALLVMGFPAMSEKVTIKLRRQTWEVEPGRTARETIKELGLNPESHLIVRNGELVTDDTILEPGDQVELIAAISGGAR
jgi:sulfur carrier protein